jgi:hypothetical protein
MIGLGGITSLFKVAGGIVDELHTSEEEKLSLKNAFAELQGNVMSDVLEYQKSLNEAQANIIMAEAGGKSWIQRSWRPVTMLTFVGIVLMRWFGLTAEVPEAVEVELMSLIKIGLGGYVAGRSVEKITETASSALKDYARTK